MSVMGFRKKWLWVGGWVEHYPVFWEFLNFAKPLHEYSVKDVDY